MKASCIRRPESALLRLWLVLFCFGLGWLGSESQAAETPATLAASKRENARAWTEYLSSEAGWEEIVFCTRVTYDDPHWYANIGYYCDDETVKAYTGNGKPDTGKLFKLHALTGQLTTLLDPQGGAVRDPQVHYDGKTILFSYRPAGTDYYHLFEIQADGTGLRQLTSGPFDDYEPCYLPDGDILFVSTRCRRWVNCWKTQVGIMYRCRRDGSEIVQVSANTEHDNTPWVMPDGRILYTRWEYVDRSQVEFHHLWVMNPDGSNQAVYYGNMRPHILMIDAKPIPGTSQVLASFSPGHGVNEHAGIATVVSPDLGPDAPAAARPLHKGRLIRDPYPLTREWSLAGRDKQIVAISDGGEIEVIHTHAGAELVHEPRPLQSRPREPILPRHTKPEESTGTMILADVYRGRNMEGVRRGDIKKLLILESLPKPVNFSGGPDLLSWLGTFTLERVLGTVPVEPDGSAYFQVPALRQVFFVALDENDLSVKRMQSFTTVMPGEVVSCVGCHEQRHEAPGIPMAAQLQALRRPPSAIEPFAGWPDVMDFTRDVQPILDRHCLRCHDYGKREGGVILAGDLGLTWSHAYFSLLAWKQVADGRNGLGNQPPRSLGSSASALLKKVDGSHYEVSVTPQEWRTLWLWLESGATYAGSYAALRNEAEQRRAGVAAGRALRGSVEVLQRRCASCHELNPQKEPQKAPLPFNYEARQKDRSAFHRPTAAHERLVLDHDPQARFSLNILLNFTRPELSPLLLGPLAASAGGYGSCGSVFQDPSDADYQKLLEALRAGRETLNEAPRFGMPGFKPNRQYLRELSRFGVGEDAFVAAGGSVDVFQADQAYWRSLYP